MFMQLFNAGAGGGSKTFYATGSEQTFVVPAGIGVLHVELWGASGKGRPGNQGGNGATVVADDLPVSHSASLNIIVGEYNSPTSSSFLGGGEYKSSLGDGFEKGGGLSGIFTQFNISAPSPSTDYDFALAIAGAGGGAYECDTSKRSGKNAPGTNLTSYMQASDNGGGGYRGGTGINTNCPSHSGSHGGSNYLDSGAIETYNGALSTDYNHDGSAGQGVSGGGNDGLVYISWGVKGIAVS